MRAKIRLYVDHPLGAEQPVQLSREQAHYLFGVMRLALADKVALFNGRDGEWTAEVVEAGKRGGVLLCHTRAARQVDPPDLWLLFAPVKKARTDFIVEKAVELGARRIVPVQTEYTNSERLRQDRQQAHAIEAAEQCGAVFVPEVAAMTKLTQLLHTWSPERQVLFCDEAAAGPVTEWSGAAQGPWAILIGPEGGFSAQERAQLTALPYVHRAALGPRILRAETAAVAAMTLWQTHLGDWT